MFLSRRTLISSALLLLLPLVQYANATNNLPNSNVASIASSQLHTATDELTFANYQQVSIRHIELALNVDFELLQLSGNAILELDWHKAGKMLVLDTRDLTINSVSMLNANGQWQAVPFSLGAADKVKGAALTINLPQERVAKIKVNYHTSKNPSGIQWLTPEQTQGKQWPFMFSQSQAIHARSWIPLQDTPAVRQTYSATVTAKQGISVVMSADRESMSAIHYAAGDSCLLDCHCRRTPAICRLRRHLRHLGRARNACQGQQRICRYAGDDRHRRQTLRRLPLGSIRSVDPPAQLPVRRDGKSAIIFYYSHSHRGR